MAETSELASGTPSTNDIIAALTDDDQILSTQETKLAQSVLSDINYTLDASIVNIATRAGVSPPTVTRFCRRLGCASFSDFKVQLAKSSYVGLRYLKPDAITNTPEEVAEDTVTKAQNALFEMHRGLDLRIIVRAVDLLKNAEMIYAFGSSGNSSMIVNELQNRLFRLGARISASNDHSMNMMLSAAAETGIVVFGSSLSGRNAELIDCYRILKKKDIPTIALTRSGSPLAELADVVIPIDLPEGQNIFRATSTRYAMLAIVDIISNLVAYADRTRSTRILRSIKQQLVKHRDGDDRQALGD